MWAFSFVVGVTSENNEGDARMHDMHDLRWIPIAVGANRRLARSAMPDAPVIADTPRRERRRLRRLAQRLVAPRARRRTPRFGKEEPCAT
jgi:hypothetical protein